MSASPIVNIVALPIGNVEDLSARAARCLREAALIFCEDTRKLKELLTRSGVESSARFVALPGGKEREIDWANYLDRNAHVREAAPKWVLVSDAGTPVVNDPGLELVRYARKQGWSISAVPGPCAPILAWQWAGAFGLPFSFAGFVPKTKNAQAKELHGFFDQAQSSGTFAYFDTRHQFEITLEHLVARGWGGRKMSVGREMTKAHEELVDGTVQSCWDSLRERLIATDALGEMTFLLEGEHRVSSKPEISLDDLILLRNSPTKAAAKIAAKLTGLSVSDCYDKFARKGATNEES